MDEKHEPPPATDAELPPKRVEDDLPPPVPLPKWVPILIALILVGMASLAIWTGLRFRNEAFTKPLIKLPQRAAQRTDGTGAPGEPQPGASRVSHGEYGENIPSPNPADLKDNAKYSISGTGHALQPSVRLAAKRGLMVVADPPDAMVYVNDNAIGEARQFSNPDDVYEFADEGSYTVRISADGFADVEYVVTARADAKDEIALIKTKLVPSTTK